jgi:LPS export ABC transporter protein LptC
MQPSNPQGMGNWVRIFLGLGHAKIAALIFSALIFISVFMPYSFNELQQASEPFVAQYTRLQLNQKTPDSYGKNLRLQTFSTAGKVKYEVRAKMMMQYFSDKTTDLQEPSIILNNEGESPWIINAQSGLISSQNQHNEKQKIVFLKGNVNVSLDLASDAYLRMSSETLQVFPDQQIAVTKQMVVVESSIFKTQAQGIFIDLANGRIEFPENIQHRVRSTLTPQTPIGGPL